MANKKQILNDSKTIAVESLKKFINNLGINPEEFNSIYQIAINSERIETAQNEEVTAVYYNKENRIAINDEVLEEYIHDIDSNQVTENRVKINLAKTITHEMIHAIRTIKHLNIENIEETNLISEFYYGDNLNEADKVIETQNEFEEIITDTLAITILLNRNNEKIDLEETNEIIEENESDDNILFGSEILKEKGIEKIKEFFLASKNKIKNYDFEDEVKEYYKIKTM